MLPVPKPWRWFPKLDILAAYLSSKGRYADILVLPRRTAVASVDDALVQLDQACADGLRASLDSETLVQLDIVVTALMEGNGTKIPSAEAILNARPLGGPAFAWNQIIVRARRERLFRKTSDAVWDWHAQIAYDALARGIDDAVITRMQGWGSDHMKHLGIEAGFRRPGETAEQNRARSKGRNYASWEVGWGIDARCRANPIRAAITECQRIGWRWADAVFSDSSRPNLREGMAVTYNMMPSIVRDYRDPPPRRW